MTVHEVKQPDGYEYHFHRSDEDKMKFNLAHTDPDIALLLAKAAAAQPAAQVTDDAADDGTTKVVSVVPVRGRLAQVLGFLGLDGRGN